MSLVAVLFTVVEKAPPTRVLVAYAVFIKAAFVVHHLVAEGALSSILTLSVMVECLAAALLGLQVVSSGSAAGISARSLALDALAICLRLSSTLWLNGYLPVDASGDWVYQTVDVCSLAIVLWLLHAVLVARRDSYQKQFDTFPIEALVLVAFLLAALLHADMDSRPIFDTFWMAGLFIGVIAVLPQLWLITRTGGSVDALTSHYIAAMALSRLLSGIFMWIAREDITCEPWFAGVSHAIWAILVAHALHLLLLADFAFYYVKAMATQGLSCRFELDPSCIV